MNSELLLLDSQELTSKLKVRAPEQRSFVLKDMLAVSGELTEDWSHLKNSSAEQGAGEKKH